MCIRDRCGDDRSSAAELTAADFSRSALICSALPCSALLCQLASSARRRRVRPKNLRPAPELKRNIGVVGSGSGGMAERERYEAVAPQPSAPIVIPHKYRTNPCGLASTAISAVSTTCCSAVNVFFVPDENASSFSFIRSLICSRRCTYSTTIAAAFDERDQQRSEHHLHAVIP